ncbi:YcaO-like family protein [Varibaculum massiliense]|uniref:YcaO-like family protein n=1 Tax=Varibaculum massiliense TaxID=1852372 RepID=UPI0008D9EF22|nr:YcaO-like family protein [Varibaculum massiliense]
MSLHVESFTRESWNKLKNIYPIMVAGVSLSADNKSITFSGLDETIVIEAFPYLWQIIEQCDGRNSVADISRKIKIEKKLVSAAVNDLMDLGLAYDSREQYLHFHKISNNPARFWRDLTSTDIANHVNSRKVPVKNGTRFPFKSHKQSSIYRLGSQRTSVRSYSDKKLDIETLGSILADGYSSEICPVPSGGALFPLKLFVIVTRNQHDFPAGYYEYDCDREEIVLYDQKIDLEQIKYIYDSETIPFEAPILIVIAGDLSRQPYKYGNRGYRFTLMECGAVAQNITLSCVEQGLGSCELGGALDDPLKKELKLGDQVFPLLSIALGYESDEKVEDSYDLLYKLDTTMVGYKKIVRKVDVVQDIQADGFFFASGLANVVSGEDAKSSYSNRFSFGVANSIAMAKVKAIAEAYERYQSGRIRVDYSGTANSITIPWINPTDFVPMTTLQRQKLNLQKFSEEKPYQWVSGKRYSDMQEVLMPIDMVFYPIDDKKLGRKLLCDSNSSGVAASTTFVDAETRALLELIERDAIMRCWFEQSPPPRLSTDYLTEHWLRRVRHWENEDRNVHVLDHSISGVDIIQVIIEGRHFPAFANGASAVIRNDNSSYLGALRKAFQEAEFALLSAIQVGRRRSRRRETVRDPIHHAEYYSSFKHAGQISWLWSGDYLDKRLADNTYADELKRQKEIITVNLSDTSLPLWVVRVFSPTLIPINFGFGNDYVLHPEIENLKYCEQSQSLPHYFA